MQDPSPKLCTCQSGGDASGVHSVVGARGLSKCRAKQVELRIPRHHEVSRGDIGDADLPRIVGLALPGHDQYGWLLASTPDLRVLELDEPGPADLEAMAGLSKLEAIGIGGCSFESLERAMAASATPGIERLNLTKVPLTTKRLSTLLGHPALASLRVLQLASCRVSARVLSGMVEVALPRLGTLHLSHNTLGDAGVEVLAASVDLPALRALHLSKVGLTNASIASLTAAPFTRQLRVLSLARNRIDAAGVEALANADLAALRHLYLGGNPIGDDGVAWLGRAPWRSRLEHLTISGRGLSDEGHRMVASSPDLLRALSRAGAWDAEDRRVFR